MRRSILFFAIASVIVALCNALDDTAAKDGAAPTAAPTTAAPTTAAPTTAAPTTAAPTTAAPTTAAPTTAAPTTAAPTTAAPTTAAPETTTKGPPGLREEGGGCESYFLVGRPSGRDTWCQKTCWSPRVGKCNWGLKCCFRY